LDLSPLAVANGTHDNRTISIASWNVNSLCHHIEALSWLAAKRRPDILCLQETKVRDWCGRKDCQHILAAAETGTPLVKLEVHDLYVPAGGELADPIKN